MIVTLQLVAEGNFSTADFNVHFLKTNSGKRLWQISRLPLPEGSPQQLQEPVLESAVLRPLEAALRPALRARARLCAGRARQGDEAWRANRFCQRGAVPAQFSCETILARYAICATLYFYGAVNRGKPCSNIMYITQVLQFYYYFSSRAATCESVSQIICTQFGW